MHIHIRIHHWVVWWFYVGVVCGAVACVNILDRDLSRAQERLILVIGALHWILGGLVCYACDGIQVEDPEHHDAPCNHDSPVVLRQDEWHAASDFLLPGNRKSLLPPKH